MMFIQINKTLKRILITVTVRTTLRIASVLEALKICVAKTKTRHPLLPQSPLLNGQSYLTLNSALLTFSNRNSDGRDSWT